MPYAQAQDPKLVAECVPAEALPDPCNQGSSTTERLPLQVEQSIPGSRGYVHLHVQVD